MYHVENEIMGQVKDSSEGVDNSLQKWEFIS